MTTFPTPATDYSATPWLDTDTGILWIYNETKTRWAKFYLQPTFVQDSPTPTAYKDGQLWFLPTTGAMKCWAVFEWVDVAGGGTPLTNYSQVAALTGYPTSFPPDAHTHSSLTGATTLTLGAFDGLAGVLELQSDTLDVIARFTNFNESTATIYPPTVSGTIAKTANTDGTPDALNNATISGATTVANGATWSYFSATEQAAHRTALGVVNGFSGTANRLTSGGNADTSIESQLFTTGTGTEAALHQVSLSAVASVADCSVFITPKGTGAFYLGPKADGTATGGGARGSRAIDLQTSRSNTNQVASGAHSVVIGGFNNRASGDRAIDIGGTSGAATGMLSIVIGGSACQATASFSTSINGDTHVVSGTYGVAVGGAYHVVNSSFGSCVGGKLGTTRGIIGYNAMAFCDAPITTIAGVSQGGALIIGAQTTDATATVLRSNTSAAAATNQFALPNNSAYHVKGRVIAGVTGAGNTSGWEFNAVIKRGANAASTVLVAAVTPTMIAQDAGASGWVVAVDADTTNGALRVTVTGQAATTIRWVCHLESAEMTY